MIGSATEKVRYGIGLTALAAVSVLVWSIVWALVAPVIFGWSPVAVTSGSMEPLIATGDIVFVSSSDGRDLEPGTVIVFDDENGGRVTHRIVDITPEGDYVTRGDANGRLDSTPVAPDQVAGVGRMIIPALGLPIVWVEHGRWLLLAFAILLTLAAGSASRWALLGRFSPWRTPNLVPPTPTAAPTVASMSTVAPATTVAPTPTRSRRRRTPVLVGVTLGVLVAGGVSIVQSRAAFVVATGNSGDILTADTLQPPTALLATGGATVTLDWTITPDTYADGHTVHRGTASGGPYALVATTTPRAVATYVDSPPAGTYYYVVRAIDANWQSVDSNEVSAVVGAAADDYDAIPAGSDNCPSTFNVDQFDTDGDGIGDACDTSPTVASSGILTTSGQALGSGDTGGVAFADFDGDGDLDAMTSNGGANLVWINDGSGTYTDSGQRLGSGDGEGLALADIDGDGDIDAMTADDGQPNRVWLNDGAGTFTDSGQALDPGDSWGIAFGDVDGDDDLDALVANSGQPNRVWLNDGTGTFTDSGQTLGSATTEHIVLGDVDGDGDLDALDANAGANRVWINDGTGTYTDSGQALGSATTHGVTLGDVDGDGDADVVYGNSGANRVWINDGTGTFTDSGQALGSATTHAVMLGDIDGDGDVDLVEANNGASRVWLNDGSGTFSDSGQALGSATTYALALGDLDADGDLDAMFGNGGANSVWINDAGAAVALTNSWQTGLAHTAGAGSDRMLVFVATNEQQSLTAPTLTGVTYGGQPLTFVMADEVGNGCCNARSEIWVLDEAGLAAASGTALAPTWSSAPNTPLYSHIVYENVDQSDPFGAQTSATVIGDTPNPVPMTSVVTSSGDMVLAVAVAGEAGTYTPQNGFTLGVDQSTTSGGTTASGTAQKSATGADETVSMLFNPAAPPWTNRQVALALVIHAAP